jgi:hypothetical protein
VRVEISHFAPSNSMVGNARRGSGARGWQVVEKAGEIKLYEVK